MNKQLIGKWLSAYGVQGFQGKVTFDYQGETEFSVELTSDERYLMLSSVVEKLDASKSDEQLRRILQLNHLGIETRGATLSIDDTGQNLVLWYSRPVDGLDPEGFDNLVGSFLDTTETLRRKIDRKEAVPASQRTEGEDSGVGKGPLVRV